MGSLYIDLREALDLAREKVEIYHIYDPEKDSLQAIIEAELSET